MRHNAPLWAALICAGVLALFYDWFAVADRYAIFLYGHTTVGISNAQPFDDLTSSRYWMSGLVACGAVAVLYSAAQWLFGRVAVLRKRAPRAPVWWQVWVWCAPALSAGILIITMTQNAPVLPLPLALACVAATLAGLGFALLPGTWAAQRPADLAWLACDGLGLALPLLLTRAIELPGLGLSISVTAAWLYAIGGVLGSLAWLAVMSVLRAWRRRPAPGMAALLSAGAIWCYLLLPLAHHLFATPQAYQYISAASNFFASDPAVLLLSFGVTSAIAAGVSRARASKRFAIQVVHCGVIEQSREVQV
jgi:hypothetical protein